MKLIQDLGIDPKNKHYQRFALYECQGCNKQFKRLFGYKHEQCSKCANKLKTTHGDSKKRLYGIYLNIKQRCLNPNNGNYLYYGAKGITICKEWQNSYFTFKKWALENGYLKELSIDRINNDGDYEPNNCRWATMKTQGRNRAITTRNKSGYIGVSWCSQTSKWKSQIVINFKSKTLLRSYSKKECAKIRDKYIKDNNLAHTLNFT